MGDEFDDDEHQEDEPPVDSGGAPGSGVGEGGRFDVGNKLASSMELAIAFMGKPRTRGGSASSLLLPDLNRTDRKALHDLIDTHNRSSGGVTFDHKSSGLATARVMEISMRESSSPVTPPKLPNLSEAVAPKTCGCPYDIRHWMGIFFELACSKESCLFPYFCTMVSSAIFILVEGEDDRLKDDLRKRGFSETYIDALPRSRYRKLCQYSVPPPRELADRLIKVYLFFSVLKEPGNNNYFFIPGHSKRFATSMEHVLKGLLSDPEGMEMYLPLRVTKSGFQIYRCLRSSSQLEGYHLHVNETFKAGGKAAGPMYKECVVNSFDFSWNVACLKRTGTISDRVHHLNFRLIEDLHSLGVAVLGAEEAVIPNWVPVRILPDRETMKRGMYYFYQAQRPDNSEPPLPARGSNYKQYSSSMVGSEVTHQASSEQISRLLLVKGAVNNSQVMQKAALKEGVLVDQKGAEKLTANMLAAQRANEILKDPPSQGANYFAQLSDFLSSRAPSAGNAPQHNPGKGDALNSGSLPASHSTLRQGPVATSAYPSNPPPSPATQKRKAGAERQQKLRENLPNDELERRRRENRKRMKEKRKKEKQSKFKITRINVYYYRVRHKDGPYNFMYSFGLPFHSVQLQQAKTGRGQNGRQNGPLAGSKKPRLSNNC
jgi:hypothetical protein